VSRTTSAVARMGIAAAATATLLGGVTAAGSMVSANRFQPKVCLSTSRWALTHRQMPELGACLPSPVKPPGHDGVIAGDIPKLCATLDLSQTVRRPVKRLGACIPWVGN
jgi:hypothetical protein